MMHEMSAGWVPGINGMSDGMKFQFSSKCNEREGNYSDPQNNYKVTVLAAM